MKTIRHRILSTVPVILLLIFCYIQASSINAKPVSIEPSESFFLENGRGSYIFVEASLPKGEGPHPVVFMAHGFAGSIHSGGAKELGARLSDAGIIAIRCDFNPYVAPNKKADRLDAYALRDMKSDAALVIEYALNHYKGDPDRIGVYGRSYGGRLAMTMANESLGGYDFKALSLVAPAGDEICFKRFLQSNGESYQDKRDQAFSEKEYGTHLGVKVYREWFLDVENYTPSDEGYKFSDKPVLLFYNTLDKVVYPDTSLRCAGAYENCEVVEITSEDGHGHEMGFEKSAIKDMIMGRIVEFFLKVL